MRHQIERFKTSTKISKTSKCIVKYGFSYIIGNKKPYFSITCDTYKKAKNNKWVYNSGGMNHKKIIDKFPELESLLKFHLCYDDGTPLYYLENGLYWYNQENLDNFKSTIIALPDEEFELGNPNMKDILIKRLQRIQNLFIETMLKFDIPFISQIEIDKLFQ